MRLWKWYLIVWFGLVGVGGAQDLQIYGYVRNYTGVLLNGDHEYAIIQNTLNLIFEQQKDRVAFKINPFIYQYPDQEMELDLREAYMDVYFPSFDLRIGRQQIIWGKADGVFITDIVSPKDLSEFLLRDFDEIRMGVTGVKLNYYRGNSTLEAVWLPVFTPTRFPDETSLWHVQPRLPVPIVPAVDASRKEVDFSLQNSEVFLRYSTLTSVVDLEFMVASAWDDDPTPHLEKQIDPQTRRVVGVTLYPQHHRLQIAGGSFSTTIGPLVLRGEGAFYRGKYFLSTDPAALDGVEKKDYLHYLLGMDFNLSSWRLSAQFIQQAILDYSSALVNDSHENMATFLARRDYWNETLHLEFFTYVGLNHQDALIRPKITYDVADGFSVLIGANIFTGDEGLFGQYGENDMLYIKVKYSF
ncbi:MAG: hypothetical protein GXO78_09210 [Calditrichaeota bacterium]|nr:hypothetical protein [Calditrichota bacterium]